MAPPYRLLLHKSGRTRLVWTPNGKYNQLMHMYYTFAPISTTHLLMHHRRGESVHLDGNKLGLSVVVDSRSSIQLRTIGKGPSHIEQGDVGAVELIEGNQGGRSSGIGRISSPGINTKLGTAEHVFELSSNISGVAFDSCTHRGDVTFILRRT